jgi:ABC-type multidrug transport system fused ATPase/permease subunit
VSLVYRPGLPPALKDCSFEIPGGAKVGCVGRTGAGKSSLFVLLFRIVDAASGTIRVDDVPISSIGLHTLRAKMAIIPQEPLLLEGSLRINIDPFEQHSDEEVDAVLKRVGLVGSDKQPHQLSFGERQLLQMARTLLRQVSIVVMDEPTSNIDPNTDETLQRVVREDFGSQTVVTIAHRLDTVIDNDKIMVLDAGRLVEYDAPALLLQDPNSHLSGMVNQQGERKAQITRGRLCQKLATQGIEIEIGPLAETPPKEVQPESDEKAELSVKLKSTDEANACLLTPFRFCWVLPGKLAS